MQVVFSGPRTSPTDRTLDVLASHVDASAPPATTRYNFGTAKAPAACWSMVNGTAKPTDVAPTMAPTTAVTPKAPPAVSPVSPALDAAAKRVLQEAASTPLPADDSDVEEASPAQPLDNSSLPASLQPSKPVFRGAAAPDTGLLAFLGTATQTTAVAKPGDEAGSNGSHKTEGDASTADTKANGGGWGAAFLAANKAAAGKATEAAADEIDKVAVTHLPSV